MKIGDLVKHPGVPEIGIVLNTYPGTANYTKVYWLGLMIFSSLPASDLEVVSEGR